MTRQTRQSKSAPLCSPFTFICPLLARNNSFVTTPRRYAKDIAAQKLATHPRGIRSQKEIPRDSIRHSLKRQLIGNLIIRSSRPATTHQATLSDDSTMVNTYYTPSLPLEVTQLPHECWPDLLGNQDYNPLDEGRLMRVDNARAENAMWQPSGQPLCGEDELREEEEWLLDKCSNDKVLVEYDMGETEVMALGTFVKANPDHRRRAIEALFSAVKTNRFKDDNADWHVKLVMPDVFAAAHPAATAENAEDEMLIYENDKVIDENAYLGIEESTEEVGPGGAGSNVVPVVRDERMEDAGEGEAEDDETIRVAPV